MRKSKAPRSLTACWRELGMWAPSDGKGKKNWSDEAKRCWNLLTSWLEEDETRKAYNFDRGGTSQFEERAKGFVEKYGPIIWPASNTDPQSFAYPRSVDAIVLVVQDLVCHRIENKWAYRIEKCGNLGFMPGGEVISTNEVGVGDLPRKPQLPKQAKPPWQAKRCRLQMLEDESDDGRPVRTKWIGPQVMEDSDTPSVTTEEETKEEYMQRHQTLFKNRKTTAPVPVSKTARGVEEENATNQISKSNSHSKTTSGKSQSALAAKPQNPSLFPTPSQRAVPTIPVPTVAPDRALERVHTSSIPRVTAALPVEALHTSQTSPPMELDLPLQVNCAPPIPSITVPDLPELDPKQLAKAFFPVELVGISYLRMLHLCEFDCPTTFLTALQSLWGLGADNTDIDHVGAKYHNVDGVIELRKGNAKDFKGLMAMTAKWLDTLKANEIAGLCPSIVIKIYKSTVEEL